MSEPRAAAPPPARIFQIFYDEASRAALDPAFVPLDNSSNERPDWAEYWPIRRFLLAGDFADDELLGFVSPRFRRKTGLTGEEALAAIADRDAEVYSFSPHLDLMAPARNPFTQGDAMHPGLLRATTGLLPRLGIRLDLGGLVCDLTTMVYANYWVARGRLWRDWLALAEIVFAAAEARSDEVGRALAGGTRHRRSDGHGLKVFVLERLITLLLESRGIAATWCLDPRRAPLAVPIGAPLVDTLLTADGLKAAYRRSPDPALLDAFDQLRGAIITALRELAMLPPDQVAAALGA
jgi:hypothetical protein